MALSTTTSQPGRKVILFPAQGDTSHRHTPKTDGVPFVMNRSQISAMKTERLNSSTSTSKTRKSATTVLEREEWFFGKVPEDEMLTCFYYEYARSRKDIHELVYAWQEKLADLEKAYDAANTWEARLERGGWWDHTFTNVETATNAFWSDLAGLTDSTSSQLLINLTEFPDTPWQRIRPARKKQWKNLLKFYHYLDSIRGGLWPETKRNTLNAILYYRMRTSLGELVPFSINWNGGVEKVITDFEKWARKHYFHVEATEKKGTAKDLPRIA